MTGLELIAAAGTIIAILAAFVGLVAWLVRLEGRVDNAASLLKIVQDSQASMAEFARTLAVVQMQIVHLENDRAPTAQILERLAGIEGQLQAFGQVLAASDHSLRD